MAKDPDNKLKNLPPAEDGGLIEGVEIDLPPLFSREMLSDTRFLLIIACAVVSAVFGLFVWLVGYEQWALSVFLFTFNVLLVCWFYFLVQNVRRQMEEEEEKKSGENKVIHQSRKAVMSEGEAKNAEARPKDDAS